MLTIPGFALQSFFVGCKHVRTFAIESNAGSIADYLLGEAGAPSSAVPAGFYKKVGKGENGIEVSGGDGSQKVTASLDRVTLWERSKDKKPLKDYEGTIARAKQLIPGVLAFLNNPKLAFLGVVLQYVKEETSERDRFKHPAAESLVKKVLRVPLDDKSHPSELNCRLSFRRQLLGSWLTKGLDDYASFHLHMWDEDERVLWEDENQEEGSVKIDPPRTTVVSIDIQRVLDPRRPFSPSLLEEHLRYTLESSRGHVQELLRSFGFAEPPKEK